MASLQRDLIYNCETLDDCNKLWASRVYPQGEPEQNRDPSWRGAASDWASQGHPLPPASYSTLDVLRNTTLRPLAFKAQTEFFRDDPRVVSPGDVPYRVIKAAKPGTLRSGRFALLSMQSHDGTLDEDVLYLASHFRLHTVALFGVISISSGDRRSLETVIIPEEVKQRFATLVIREDMGAHLCARAQMLRLFPELWSPPELIFTDDSQYGPLTPHRFMALLDRISSNRAQYVGMTETEEGALPHLTQWHFDDRLFAFKSTMLAKESVQTWWLDRLPCYIDPKMSSAKSMTMTQDMRSYGVTTEPLFSHFDKQRRGDPALEYADMFIERGFCLIPKEILLDRRSEAVALVRSRIDFAQLQRKFCCDLNSTAHAAEPRPPALLLHES